MNLNSTLSLSQKVRSHKTINVEEMVEDFFEQMEAFPAKQRDGDGLSKLPSSHDIITGISCLAEQQAGYRAKEMGWLAWFGQVIRGERKLLRQVRNDAKLWPSNEREIFELYFIDGMALRDIAAKMVCKSQALDEHLTAIQYRIRYEIVRQVLCESRAKR